ncbi:hypothetical protein EIN_184940 [Entamoeba invadens IP1]|uniref:hypothetical protein n=1 Tax=Entamoeba invadens IP1 TaxID=370355 RepID=UPI0002C3D1D2|nr:hypothetical protein EIN_184940 [Entamoeba invadens IP1]ELP94117.1 hypothetical protein EIN_184940 [Entamoeba invadens IP1]|eukprot:XP_004260888.1 hypothetical protein EIN_184940 [Entamoeba invadens IP1]
MSQTVNYKIILLGSGSVGKSAIAAQYVKNMFLKKYEPTIEDISNKTIEVDGIMVHLEIFDTAGADQFLTMQDLYIKEGDGFILVFSWASVGTFQELEKILQHVIDVKESMKQTDIPIVIAGNKCDLEEDQKTVTMVDAQDFATNKKCMFMETSAKTTKNISEMFELLAKKLLEKRKPMKKSHHCTLL